MIDTLKFAFRRSFAACALALAALVLAPPAQAESVEVANGYMLGGKLTSSTELDFTSPGKLTVRVTDMGTSMTIVDRLMSLSFSITNGSTQFGSHMNEGTLSVDILDPGSVTLNIFAAASRTYGLGAVSWNAAFEPGGSVPLPASFYFLFAGIAWAIGLQRKRAKLAGKESSGFSPWSNGPALAH